MTTPLNTTSRDGYRGYETATGDWYVGVTSLIRATLADPKHLANWKQKRFAQSVIDILGNLNGAYDDDYVVNEALQRQWYSGPEALLGTAVHSAIENYERDQVTVDDVKVASYLAQWIDLRDDHDLQVVASEITLVNTTLGYAGTADAIVRTTIKPYARDLFILDYKTGKGVYDTYALQLALLSRCDSVLEPDGTLRKLAGTNEAPNAQWGLIAKLGPQSAHMHKVDVRVAWKTARVLPDLWAWQHGAGKATISDSLPGKARLAHRDVRDERRLDLLARARELDLPVRAIVRESWRDTWPALTEPTLDWTLDNLDEVEALIANAERGALA
jgi:hypothetical protein